MGHQASCRGFECGHKRRTLPRSGYCAWREWLAQLMKNKASDQQLDEDISGYILTMKKKQQKCADPHVGNRIPLEIVFSIGAGKVPFPKDLKQGPELSPESRHHLETCESCRDDLRENLSLWYTKGMSSYRTSQAFGIVNASEGGDKTILRRNLSSGVALFKPDQNRKKGLVVVVTPEHYVHDSEEKTLEEFMQMR